MRTALGRNSSLYLIQCFPSLTLFGSAQSRFVSRHFIRPLKTKKRFPNGILGTLISIDSVVTDSQFLESEFNCDIHVVPRKPFSRVSLILALVKIARAIVGIFILGFPTLPKITHIS